jgi:hypothetical protein
MATDSMTVKITPNGRGSSMTSTGQRRFSEREIGQASTSMPSTGSSAPVHATFERHYRIGELAETWQLGRETVRRLVKEGRGVIKIASAKKAHTIYSGPSRWHEPHPPAQQPLVAAAER